MNDNQHTERLVTSRRPGLGSGKWRAETGWVQTEIGGWGGEGQRWGQAGGRKTGVGSGVEGLLGIPGAWSEGTEVGRGLLTAKSLQSCPTLCDPIDGSPPGSPVPGILQTRTLEWVAISFSDA